MNKLLNIISRRNSGEKIGVYSACTANEFVIEAVLEKAKETNTLAIIEATSNQVNQFGGYTNMTPKDFSKFVHHIAKKIDFPLEKLILGGDHLGPLLWQQDDVEEAMAKSEELVRQYVLAGFTKIHIDTSMFLKGDNRDIRLSDEIIADRAVRLIKTAENAFCELSHSTRPVYIIGSEVPIPGGATENEDTVCVTSPKEFEQTLSVFKEKFENCGLFEAFENVVAIVVQPGVEFADASIIEYNRNSAKSLCAALKKYPNLVFEGHSTDYQTKEKLKEMVEDGIAILKVGPALTFALREALFALESIENEIFDGSFKLSNFRTVLEKAMIENPLNWEKHYHGNDMEKCLKRKYSFADRSRYYLNDINVKTSISNLICNINEKNVPISLFSQYAPMQYIHARECKISFEANDFIKDRIKECIDDYLFAIATTDTNSNLIAG